MTRYTALLDANVLYPAPTRDVLMELAVTDIFRARWTADIHREWIDALMRSKPSLDRAKLERIRERMDHATRDNLITGYESFIDSLVLPDPNDRHVLAAAIVGRCDAIVTFNLSDFPEDILAPFAIEAQHPDDFLRNQLDLAPGLVCGAIHKVRNRLKSPPYSAAEYLATLTRQGLVAFAAEMEQYSEVI